MDHKSRLRADLGKTSTPIRHNAIQSFQKGNEELSPVVAVAKKKKLIVLIAEAIKAIGAPRKGASYLAIKKWIIDSQGNETRHFKKMLKLALIKGLSTGEIIRASHCQTSLGANGSFKLPKEIFKPSKKTEKPIAKKVAKAAGKNPIEKKVAKAAGKNPIEKKVAKAAIKNPIEKKVAKAAGKKAPVKPAVAKSKDEKISTEAENKRRIKTASKQPNGQISKKEDHVSKKDPSAKKPIRVKKGEKKVANVINNTEKEIKKEKLTENKLKGENVKENTKNEKQPKKKETQSGQSEANKKEKSKTLVEKIPKVARSKKLYASKRKDFSDTELDVTNHRPMPMKSYSSDTEVEKSKRQDINGKKNTTRAKERKMPGKK